MHSSHEFEPEERWEAIARRLPGDEGPAFSSACALLQRGTPANFMPSLRYAQLVGLGRSAKDIDVAVHPFNPLDVDLNGDGDCGYIPELTLHYGAIDVDAAAAAYVDRMRWHFGNAARRQVATILQNTFLQDSDYQPDIVSARHIRALLRDVHSAGIPEYHDQVQTGYLSPDRLCSFLVGMRHDDPMCLRGIRPDDVVWLHGASYDLELRQFAEQLFAALHLGVYMPPSSERRPEVPLQDSALQQAVRTIRSAIERLTLLREEGGIRYGIVWDQEYRRRHTAVSSSISAQLTGLGTVVLPIVHNSR